MFKNSLHVIRVHQEDFTYENQSKVIKIPNEWIDDERCFSCRYKSESVSNLCHCKQENDKLPHCPLRRSNKYRNKDTVPTEIRVSKFNDESKQGKFLKYLDPKYKTIFDALRRGNELSENGPCLGYRKSNGYEWLTYKQVLKRVNNFGSGLVAMGLEPSPSSYIGIYSKNCVEWSIAEHAVYSYSMVLIPLYEQLGVEAIDFVIRETKMSVLIVQTHNILYDILQNCDESLKVIISIHDVDNNALDLATEKGIKILRFLEVEEYGARHFVEENPPHPNSPALIIFSQIGTFSDSSDGRPKGIILSHENVISCSCSCIKQLSQYAFNSHDCMISYLSMAHMLERCVQVAMLYSGGSIGFYSGNMKFLYDDMSKLKPTICPGVPKFLNQIYDKIIEEVSPSNIKRKIFTIGLRCKMKEMSSGIVRDNGFLDKMLFRSVKDMLGGKIRLMIVGSAPLSGNILSFMRATTGCLILEGYGLTECTACCSLSVQGDSSTENVGPPIACCAIKLVDVPDMEYSASSGQGEVCVRGSNVFLGYFKDPERTRQAIDCNGWLHTGDIGIWLPNGTLKIIGRTKHFFKLSQGDYIYPEKIENIYLQSKYVEQVFVYGESLKSCIIGIIVPNFSAIKEWALLRDIPSESFSEMCHNEEIKNHLLHELNRLSLKASLKNFEMVKDIYLHPALFSCQNGLLNSAGKIQRRTLKEYFKPQLEDMYIKLS